MHSLLKKSFITMILPTVLFSLSACSTTGSQVDVHNEGDVRRVGNVVWSNQADVDINNLLSTAVADNKIRLIFIREHDDLSKQTSSNIAINNSYQVSLHAGSYTVVDSCIGINQLSAHATGFKQNDLLAKQQDYRLEGGQTYFFYINMAKSGEGTLQQVTTPSGLQLAEGKRYQAHQISRVLLNCPETVKPAVVVAPLAPILAEKLTIDLELLFATDDALVRPQDYPEIKKLAEFMEQYPSTLVAIEGHTDSRGSDSYNQKLSQRRVNAVKDVLISQFGIATERLTAVGYGESQPRASNESDEGRQMNRRVVAVVEERTVN